MDSLTHIYFADRILAITRLDQAAAVASLFPQIDRQPAYFHRMYGHPFFKIASLVPVAIAVYRDGEAPEDCTDVYAAQRFVEERPRMQRFIATFLEETGRPAIDFDPDVLSVTLAWASHTYQDIFNNPMQGFLPRTSVPCGKWDLWESMPDAIEFRTALYHEKQIEAFRTEFFASDLWNVELAPEALLKAMVEFTAQSGAAAIPEPVVEEAFGALRVGRPSLTELAAAREFLVKHEHLLSTLIQKYGGAGLGDGARAAAFPIGS